MWGRGRKIMTSCCLLNFGLNARPGYVVWVIQSNIYLVQRMHCLNRICMYNKDLIYVELFIYHVYNDINGARSLELIYWDKASWWRAGASMRALLEYVLGSYLSCRYMLWWLLTRYRGLSGSSITSSIREHWDFWLYRQLRSWLCWLVYRLVAITWIKYLL